MHSVIFTCVPLSMLLKLQGDNSKMIVPFCNFLSAFPVASTAEHEKDMPPNLPFYIQIKGGRTRSVLSILFK